MALHIHSSVAGSGPAVILLHGLFGMGSNLGALARELQGSYTVYSLDLPNHGRSGWMDDMRLETLAAAVLDWMGGQRITSAAIVGHSLGGKVAMQIALNAPTRVDKLVVADIAPVGYEHHHNAIFSGLRAVADKPPENRSLADDILERYIHEELVRQFLLLSLSRGDDGLYHWRFNLDALEAGYEAVVDGLESGQPYPGPVLFLKGELSDYIRPEHKAVITALFPAAQLKVLPGCGHWLHAQEPRLFNALVRRFLDAAE